MYKLRPIFQSLEETAVSTCMYRMRKITLETENSVTSSSVGGPANDESAPSAGYIAEDDQEIQELEKRWTMITSRLEQLRSDISELECSPTPLTSSIEVVPPEFHDFVIRAHPSRPPYSLQLLKKQLESHQIRVFASTHVHSSSSDVDPQLKQFLQSDSQLERRQAHLVFTLIWIKGQNEEPAMMISPSSQSVPIHGEANIARYLARLMPGLGYENKDPLEAIKLDQLLDLTDASAGLGLNSSKRDRTLALHVIEQSLNSAASLAGGSEMTWVDAVLYSAAIHAKLDVDKDVGKNTRSWFQRCQGITQPKTCCPAPTATKRSVLENYLTELDVSFRTMEHPAVFTVAAMMEHVFTMPGHHAKNLFVKDKKSSKLFLITARHNATVSLSSIAKSIGAKELRFADEETLLKTLAVAQGSVTPFALMNDRERQVHFVLDHCLFDRSDDYVNFHPLSNDATTSITIEGFKRFLKATGHEPVLIKLETK